MKNKVLLAAPVVQFIKRQPPATRTQLRAALHAVENGEVFPEPFEDELEGFYKLKVDRFRFILQSEPGESGPVFKVVFAERRKVVYEMFSQILGLE